MRRVIVVGGTSGIGRGIADRFASDGAQVLATGASTAETEAARATAPPANLAFETLDVRDANAVAALMTKQPSLDVLVNCAGVIRRNDEHDPEVFATVIDINLTGSMRTCSAARPLLA
jgi:NAD(P)-dependent dehydrogenase (short-subunit alcohol dehydrogenase family)